MSLIASPQGRRYGRSEPIPLPVHRMITRVAAVPDYVDLREWDGPIKDQGSEGSCTGHAGAESIEWIFRKYFSKEPILSPQYVYANELIAQGDFPQDVGSDGTTLCEQLIVNGACESSLYPYEAGSILLPNAAQIANGKQYATGAFHGLQGSKVALSVLGDPVPWPVQVGFTVYNSFESDYTAKTGIMTVPVAGEPTLGGHEVKLSGYDVGTTPTIRPAECPPAVLVQNSWGTEWGLKGYFWMPLEILDAADTDLKITHTGHPW